MKTQLIELDVDCVGSQDPADQPTAEELAALSRYFQAQKQRREAEAAQRKLAESETASEKAA